MSWLRSTSRPENPRKDRIATADEIRMAIDAEHDYLYWIALLITGDPALADKCLVDAIGVATLSGGVFYDWLSRWARSATARLAAKTIHDLLITSSRQYATHACEHTNHTALSVEETESLRQIDPRQVISELDPISRASLIMRGVQGFSVSGCALFIEAPRRCVIGAYCRALRWLSEKSRATGHLRHSIDPLLEIFPGDIRWQGMIDS